MLGAKHTDLSEYVYQLQLIVFRLQNSNLITFLRFSHTGKEDARRLNGLKQQLVTTSTSVQQLDPANGTSQRDRIRHEIEDILASDCLYCGEYMIDNIDRPFIDDWDKVNTDWQ